MKTKPNPWLGVPTPHQRPGTICRDAEDQVAAINASFDPEWLHLVVEFDRDEETVIRAAICRLEKVTGLISEAEYLSKKLGLSYPTNPDLGEAVESMKAMLSLKE
jgi:hypothetical protein